MEVNGSKLLKVDPKGRIFLPKSVLEPEEQTEEGYKKVVTQFWLTPGLDGCLWLLDQAEWRRTQRRLRSMDVGDERLRAVHRYFFERSDRVKPDSQGRILLSKSHLELAGITNQAVLLGVAKRIEIWDPATYEAFSSKAEPNVLKDLEAILSGGEGAM